MASPPSAEIVAPPAEAASARLRLLLGAHAIGLTVPAAAAGVAGRIDAAAAFAAIGCGLLVLDLVGWRLLRTPWGRFVPPALAALGAAVLLALALQAEGPAVLAALALGLFLSGTALLPAEPTAVAPDAAPADMIEHSARFAAEFERTGHGWFWETDAEGRLTYLSEPLVALLGRSSAELIGRPLTDLFASEEAERNDILRSERSVAFYLSARMPFSEVTVRAALEEERWWSVTGRPLFDEAGEWTGFRGIGTDLSDRRRAEAELWRLARYDSLTGLPNREHILRALDQAFRASLPGRETCSLMLLDLDGFKAINDSQGHLAGDELLAQVAKRLTELFGKIGHVGRLGGDEFKVVLPRLSDRERLTELAERCVSYLAIPYRINGCTFSATASIGIAVADAGDQLVDDLIRRADLALYAAKEGGRGQFRFFEPEMQTVAQDRQLLEHDLKQALTDGGLSLFFQPVVATASEELAGFEALIRWEHPVQGYISPALFIPIAEEMGLIGRLGEWVIRTACAEAAKWPPSVFVGVNLSPIQFRDPNLPAIVLSAIGNAQIPAGRLELEVTEGVFLDDDPRTDQTFAKLKSLGVRLALDDFGTGYSSFGYLKKAPFDKIKIDQSFVRGATVAGSRNSTILKAIIDLADGLGMDTTAEGAETQDELELVQRLGCSHVQGFVFGRPIPAAEAAHLACERASLSATGFVVGRKPRQRLIRKGLLNAPHLKGLPILVRNISEGGALIETSHRLEGGTPVQLEIAGSAAVDAEVRWSRGNRTGLRFRTPFSPSALIPSRGSKPASEMLTPAYIESGEYLNKDRAAGIG